jgi:hypothetical protein
MKAKRGRLQIIFKCQELTERALKLYMADKIDINKSIRYRYLITKATINELHRLILDIIKKI